MNLELIWAKNTHDCFEKKGLPKSLEKCQIDSWINSWCDKSIPKSIQKKVQNLENFKLIRESIHINIDNLMLYESIYKLIQRVLFDKNCTFFSEAFSILKPWLIHTY